MTTAPPRTAASAWRPILLVAALLACLFGAVAPAGAATAEATIPVTVTAATKPGDTVLISGNTAELGNWNPAAAVPLHTTAQTYPAWSGYIQIIEGSTAQYKFLIRSSTGAVTWESVPNRTVTHSTTVPVAINDRWNVGSGAPVTAVFRATATTAYGQNLYLAGNLAELGGWDPAKAVPLSTDGAHYPLWTAGLQLPPNTPIEYKYLIKNPDGTVVWENGGNRTAVTPATGTFTTNDTWR
ncbi:carbohydrate-binding module family 20 domain-containing protein [Kitasatospora phosalacinea]|uniref:carbohydrate-binding module family 20 domain-containing protein n=1 Tax=Kitasatospora phosalacinea TaxID=2065 RepID=UPI00052546CD|nr:carbohydrate-binding module family 20 domain-containing protein [Kitasatospora phosalacinea]